MVSLFTVFKQKMMLMVYSFVWLLLIPFLLINFLVCWLFKRPGYSSHKLSRFGLSKVSKSPEHILIHCASVGEVVAIQTLVNKILEGSADTKITITTNTNTGEDRVRSLFNGKVHHYYLPYDFPVFTWIFLKNQSPSLLLINEVELWPNLCRTAKKNGIPLYLVNGRMSISSTKTYAKLPSLFQPMFFCFTHICAQGQRDYENYLSLGIAHQKVTLTNNIKFELNISQQDNQLGLEIAQRYKLEGRYILLAGSTHDPEENVLLNAFQTLSIKFPSLLLVIVPRHPQRFEKVHQSICEQMKDNIRMTRGKPITTETKVLLCDQMGQLRALYALADIAFVGGSIAKRGGHNALEPAVFNVPIIMGSSRFNNPAICQALEVSGALKLTETVDDIITQCTYWLANEEQRKADGVAGGSVLNTNKGAVEKTLEIIGQKQV